MQVHIIAISDAIVSECAAVFQPAPGIYQDLLTWRNAVLDRAAVLPSDLALDVSDRVVGIHVQVERLCSHGLDDDLEATVDNVKRPATA